MHCFLFKKFTEYFTKLSKNCRKKHLKTCLSFHYKLCESVEELQTFLRPMFVSLTLLWCPMFCYLLYYLVFNKESELLIFLVVLIGFVFFLFILILSVMIAMIDVVAKECVHSVYGCALKLANKQATFPVILIKISISLYFFFFILCFIYFQMRLYLNRVLMSTIGLEILEKPINFENILNVRNN